ncbi:hypothetical protein INT43_004720 [Umbelopsis isabellina]|uniref:Uncharacterized protein n=1 Tax=Mortierella isabellina TaxID=91625 RepID=A0A8H7U771_MORIS|nr:hypothetical protein INT43_004720 [Umbelopsis isabellina]
MQTLQLLWWRDTSIKTTTEYSSFLRTLQPVGSTQLPPLNWQPVGTVQWSGALPGSIIAPGTFAIGGTSPSPVVSGFAALSSGSPVSIPTLAGGQAADLDFASFSLLPLLFLFFVAGVFAGAHCPFPLFRPRSPASQDRNKMTSPAEAAPNVAFPPAASPSAFLSSSRLHYYSPTRPPLPRPKSQKDFPRSNTVPRILPIHLTDMRHKFTFT